MRYKEEQADISGLKCYLCHSESLGPYYERDGFQIVKCHSCNFVFMANPSKAKPLRDIPCKDEAAEEMKPLDASFIRMKMAKWKKAFSVIEKYKRNGLLLDVGSASGTFLLAAKKKGWDAYGVENNLALVRIAKRQFGLNHVYSGMFEDVDFDPGVFDAITFWDTLEHMFDPQKSLAKARILLKNDGLLFLKVPNIEGAFTKCSYLVAKFFHLPRMPVDDGIPGHLFYFSEKTLDQLLAKCGYEVVDTVHTRTFILYHFGEWLKAPSLRKVVFMMIFIPLLVLGPFTRSGDSIIVTAKKRDF